MSKSHSGLARNMMSTNEVLAALSDEELVRRRTDWESRLADPADTPIYLMGVPRSGSADMAANPVLRLHESLTAVHLHDRAAEDLEIYLREMPEKVYYVEPCEGMPLQTVQRLAQQHKIIIMDEAAKVS